MISVGFGIFNIIISIMIYLALRAFINQEFAESTFFQIQVMNLGSKIEIITKPLGLIIGILGIREANVNRTTAIVGVLINGVVIVWKLALFAGVII